MAILKIARMGHPVLLQRAEPVPDPGAPEMRRLVADMIETMEDAGGVGLAAPQVHVPLRVFVFRVPPSRAGGVVTVHDLAFLRLTSTVTAASARYRALVPRSVRRARVVVTPSRAVAEQVREALETPLHE